MAYDAFISYSHAADGRLAPSLQNGLQRLGSPWYRRRSLRIFRDQTNLAASPSLWTSIVEALDNARHFLFLASPEAAASQWVRKEIAHWLSSHPPETVLIALTGGEIVWDDQRGDFDPARTTAVPEELCGVFRDEPLHVDLRWINDETQLNLNHPDFLNAVADLAAPIHGRDKDELVGEDIRQHKRTKFTAWTGGLLVASLAVAAGVAAYQASIEREQKEQQRKVAQAGRLAAESRFALDERRYDLALLLSVEANRLAGPGADSMTRTAPFRALYQLPQLAQYLHTGSPAVDVAYSADGKQLALLLSDRRIALWDAQTGKIARHLDVPPPTLPSQSATRTNGRLHFSDDGRSLALLEPARLLAWDLENGVIAKEVLAPQVEVENTGGIFQGPVLGTKKIIDTFDVIAISEDHRFAATAQNKFLRESDGTNSIEIRTLGADNADRFDVHYEGRVTALAFFEDEQLLIGDGKGRISIIDLASRAKVGEPIETGRPIDHLAVDESGFLGSRRTIVAVSNPATNTLVFASEELRSRDTAISLWDGKTRASRGVDWRFGDAEIIGLATLNGLLVTQAEAGSLRFWDLNGKKAFDNLPKALGQGSQRFALARKAFSAMSLVRNLAANWGSGDNSSLGVLPTATIDRDGTVVLLDLLGASTGGARVTPLSDVNKGFGLSGDGRIAVISSGGGLQFRDLGKNEIVATITGSDDLRGVSGFFKPARPLGAAADGIKIAFGDKEGLSIMRADGPAIRLETGADLTATGWHPDGGSIATGGRNGVVNVWDTGDGRVTATLPPAGAEERITTLAFSPDGRLLAVSSASIGGFGFPGQRRLRIWDTTRGERVTEVRVDPVKGVPQKVKGAFFLGNTNVMSNVRWSPDGRRLAIQFADGTLLLWDIDNQRPVAPPIRSETGELAIVGQAMAFSPDGGLLAVASGPKQVSLSLVDVNTGRAIGGPLWQAAQTIVGLAFSEDGSTLRALAQNGNLIAWDIAGPAWQETACRVANRNLGCGEWVRYFGDEPYRKTCPTLDGPDEC